MASVVSEYMNILYKHKEMYGDETVVLMQVGSFYEMYGVDNETETVGNVADISRLLNIVLTKRNKKIPGNSRQNPLMLGFPCLALSKYVPVLLEDDYTIVVVDQVKTELSIKRAVANVISPSTYIEGNHDEYAVLIYVERVNKSMHVGMSGINVMTGKSVVYECHSAPDDEQLPLDSAVSFVQQHRPREIVLSSHDRAVLEDIDLVSHFGLSDKVKYLHRQANKIACSISYQNKVLGNVWPNNTMWSNIELVNLECMPSALICYVLLIEYIYAHNPMLIKKISMPDIFVPREHLVLATNTIEQLNIVKTGSKKLNSVFNVINNCSTNMGRRLLKARLLCPICDPDRLEERYGQTEDYGAVLGNTRELERLLASIADVEKLARRMSLGIMSPNELANMHASCLTVLAVQNVVADERRKRIERIMLSSQGRAETEEFINACEETFDVDSLLAHDLDNANALTSIFCKGVFKQIDELQNTIQTEMAFIEGLAQELSACIGGGVKVEYLNSCGYYITVKNGRASKLREAVLGDAQLAAMKLSFKTGNMTTRITSNEIDAASRSISERSSTLRASAKRYYKHVLSALHNSYGPLFKRITAHISTLDVTKSNYKTAVMYNYCRPQIVRERTPFIDAYDLRHPIMERIDMETEYIPNNIRIGSEHTGIVLYSMNAGGKTSLLKACGISVILAQMGSFVPASSYSFSPFKSLMTRILSEDNVLKGRSSFVAEMSELRSILKRADGETLVLADEITHGTEHTSGSAIFTSSVMTLAERRVNFMFTTHLHNVYPLIKDMPNVMVCHLSVSVRDGIVVFDRKLTDGPGDSIYGLEVCESLNMDAEFLARAFKIRDKIECNKSAPMLSPLKIKPSRYNKSRLVQSCKICNYSPRCDTDIPLDVHHIKHKCARNDQGFIDNIHVDTLSNLIVLCKQCHIKAHNGDLKIAGYLSTTKGLVLDIDVTRKHFT